jgi:hypothetical protein
MQAEVCPVSVQINIPPMRSSLTVGIFVASKTGNFGCFVENLLLALKKA